MPKRRPIHAGRLAAVFGRVRKTAGLHRGTLPALACLALGAATRALPAQCVPQFVPASSSTRALAMGGVNLTGRDDDVLFANPARLAVARGTSAAFERFDDSTRAGTIASSARMGSGGIGVGANYLTGQSTAGECDVLGSPLFSVPMSRVAGAVAIARTYGGVQLGVAGKYVARTDGDRRDSRLLADVGVAHDFGIFDRVPVSAALAVQNIGDREGTEAVALQAPLQVTGGASASAPVGAFDLALAGQIAVRRNGRSIWRSAQSTAAVGAELSYMWLDGYSVAVRVGARGSDALEGTGHYTAGAGLVLDRVSIDYALEELHGYPGTHLAHRIGLRLK